MATWMQHLAIANLFFPDVPSEARVLFAVGNIAPDSGAPDGKSGYSPPKVVTHWREKENVVTPETTHADEFANRYLRDSTPEKPVWWFYLGYYFHLLTDLWANEIIFMPVLKDFERGTPDFLQAVARLRLELAGGDFDFYRTHSNFPAYLALKNASPFTCNCLEYLPCALIDSRIQGVIRYYENPPENLPTKYACFSLEQWRDFAPSVAEKIYQTANWEKLLPFLR